MAVAALVSAAMVTLSWVLGPKTPTRYKSSAYECGVEPVGNIHERFPIKFYLVAMLFILFDIEVVFLWGWMTTFLPAAKAGDTAFVVFSFFEMLAYMGTWVLGYVYAIRVGAINWDEAISLPAPKEAAREDLAVAG